MNTHDNIATRRPTETGTAVVGLLAIVLVRLLDGDEELALALAGLLALLPSGITWAVELRRRGHGFPEV